jgi:peptidoglycan/LPS O-acetylase OafA/YrhL
MLTSLTYTNEIWSVSVMSFSNVPYWSLCYEMWYYAFFAVITFTRGTARVALTTLVALIVGPKILLLAPLWVLGVVIHRSKALARTPRWAGWMLFLASFPLYWMLHTSGWREAGSDWLLELLGPVRHANLVFSKWFPADYLLGLIVAANFVGFRAIAADFAKPLGALEKPIRWLAVYTFPLYILHQPLLLLFGALINGDSHSDVFYYEVLALTLATVLVCGYYAEIKRPRVRVWLRARLAALTAAPWWRGTVTRYAGIEGSKA